MSTSCFQNSAHDALIHLYSVKRDVFMANLLLISANDDDQQLESTRRLCGFKDHGFWLHLISHLHLSLLDSIFGLRLFGKKHF